MTLQARVDGLYGCWSEPPESVVEDLKVSVGAQLSAGGMKFIHQCQVMAPGKQGKWCDCVLAVARTCERGSRDQRMQGALEEEIRIMKRLQSHGSHPQVVQLLYYAQNVLDDGTGDTAHFAIIEKVHPIGYDLDCVINKYAWMQVQVPVPFTKHIIAQLLKALSYIHKCGVIHRDCKAQNVLVGSQNHCKLIDFGLAACFPAGGKFSHSHLSWEERYFAPEMMIGSSNQNEAVDCWGLGIILHQIYQRRTSVVRTEHGELAQPNPILLGDKRNRFKPMDSSTETAMRSLLLEDPETRWNLNQLRDSWIELGDCSANELEIPVVSTACETHVEGHDKFQHPCEHLKYFSNPDPRLAVYCTTIGWRQVASAKRGELQAKRIQSSPAPSLSLQDPVRTDSAELSAPSPRLRQSHVKLEKGMIVWHVHPSRGPVLAKVLDFDDRNIRTKLMMDDCWQWVNVESFYLCEFQEGEVYEVVDDGGLLLRDAMGETHVLPETTLVQLEDMPLTGMPESCDSPATWAPVSVVGQELCGRVPLYRDDTALVAREGIEGCTLGELGIGPKSALTVLLVTRDHSVNACPDKTTELRFGDTILFAERSRGAEDAEDLLGRLGFNLQNAREVGAGPLMEVTLDFDCFTFPKHIESFPGASVSIGPRGVSTNPPDICLDIEQNFHVKLAGVVNDRTGAIEWFPGPKTLVRPGDKGLVTRIPQLDGTSRSCPKTSQHLEALMSELHFSKIMKRNERANRRSSQGGGYPSDKRGSKGLSRHRETWHSSRINEEDATRDLPASASFVHAEEQDRDARNKEDIWQLRVVCEDKDNNGDDEEDNALETAPTFQ